MGAAKETEKTRDVEKCDRQPFVAFSVFLEHQRSNGNKAQCLQSSSRRTHIANLACKGSIEIIPNTTTTATTLVTTPTTTAAVTTPTTTTAKTTPTLGLKVFDVELTGSIEIIPNTTTTATTLVTTPTT